MLTRLAIRLYACASVAAFAVIAAAPAAAQFKPPPEGEPVVGELYHIEGSAGLWWPSANILITSSGSGNLAGIVGTGIDLKRDLGLMDKRVPDIAAERI